MYVADETGGLYRLDGSTGLSRIWTGSDLGTGALTSPAVSNHLVYVGSTDETVYAVNDGFVNGQAGGQVNWSRPLDGAINGPVALNAGYLYATTANGSVYAMWPTTVPGNHNGGADRWSHFNQPHGAIDGGVAVYGSALYFGTADGYVYSLNRTTGAENWHRNLEDRPLTTTPTVGVIGQDAVPTVYVTTGTNGSSDFAHIVALYDNGTSSTVRWDVHLGGQNGSPPLQSSPALITASTAPFGPILVFGTPSGNVCAVDAAGGGGTTTKMWSYQIPGKNFSANSSPVIAGPDGKIVLIGADDGRLYGIREVIHGNNPNALVVWNSTVAVPDLKMRGSIAVSNDRIYYGVSEGSGATATGHVFAFKPFTGGSVQAAEDIPDASDVGGGGCTAGS